MKIPIIQSGGGLKRKSKHQEEQECDDTETDSDIDEPIEPKLTTRIAEFNSSDIEETSISSDPPKKKRKFYNFKVLNAPQK